MGPRINHDQSSETIRRRYLRALHFMHEARLVTRARLRRQHPDANPQQFNDILAAYYRRSDHGPDFVEAPCTRFLSSP